MMSYQHAPLRKKTAQEKLDRFASLVKQHQQAPREIREMEYALQQQVEKLCSTEEFRQVKAYYYGEEQTCNNRVLVQTLASQYREPSLLLEKHDRQLFMAHLDEQYSEEDDGLASDGPQPLARGFYSTETQGYTASEPAAGSASPQYEGPHYDYDPMATTKSYRGSPPPQVSEAYPYAPPSPQYCPGNVSPQYVKQEEGVY